MKDKYGDQDEEDRQMRMALTGSKKVQGFDLNKHQQFKKHGSLLATKQDIDEEVGDDDDTAPTEAATEPESEAQDEEQKQVVPTEEDEEESKQEEDEEVKQEGVNEAEEEGKVAEGGEASAAGAGAEAGGEDIDDEEELAKLIKEEDINMVPESTDVSEIDKLTGIPKNNGK